MSCGPLVQPECRMYQLRFFDYVSPRVGFLGFFLDFCFVKRSFWGALGVRWESSQTQQRSARTNWTFGQFLFGTRLGPPKRCLVPSISKIHQAVLQVLRQTSPNALDTPDITADPTMLREPLDRFRPCPLCATVTPLAHDPCPLHSRLSSLFVR